MAEYSTELDGNLGLASRTITGYWASPSFLDRLGDSLEKVGNPTTRLQIRDSSAGRIYASFSALTSYSVIKFLRCFLNPML